MYVYIYIKVLSLGLVILAQNPKQKFSRYLSARHPREPLRDPQSIAMYLQAPPRIPGTPRHHVIITPPLQGGYLPYFTGEIGGDPREGGSASNSLGFYRLDLYPQAQCIFAGPEGPGKNALSGRVEIQPIKSEGI